MAEAPTVGEETLGPDDAVDMLEELLPAQNKSYELGLKFKLPHHEVESIHNTYSKPRSRLLHILIGFTNQTEPRPTWRVIVEALKSPAVDLPALARRVEAAHCPDPTATHDVVAETTDTEPAANSTAGDGEVKSKPLQIPVPVSDSSAVAVLQEQVKGFHRRFNSMKLATIQCLETCRITIATVVFLLTSALSENKAFLDQKQKELHESKNHWELFNMLNLYWNYLSFGLLDGLIDGLSDEKSSDFGDIKKLMNQYKEDIQRFRENTKLVLFCQLDYSMLAVNQLQPCNPPPEFRTMVVEHQWPETVTLKDVEEFRKAFLLCFGLSECAIMVHRIRRKCFEITWFGVIPESVGQLLRKSNGKIKVLKDFNVILVEIDGECVYQSPADPIQSILPIAAGESEDSLPTTHLQEQTHVSVISMPAAYHKQAELQASLCSAKPNRFPEIMAKDDAMDVLEEILPAQNRSYELGLKLKLPHQDVESIHSAYSKTSFDESERLLKVAKLKHMPKTLPRNMLFVQCGHENISWQVDRGSAATDGEFIYFSSYNITTIYKFELRSRKWKELRPFPYFRNSGLVVIDKKLTTVGGIVVEGRCRFFTKKLLTLQQKKWVEEYPPMITACSSPAVVSTSDGEYIIVIGGLARGLAHRHRDCWTATAELLEVETKVWYKLSDLPQPLDYPSATICDNQLYVIGGDHPNGYSYSLQALQSFALEVTQNLVPWVPLPPLPVTGSTAATLCGQLVIVGGVKDRSLVNSIHQLEDGQWVEIGHMEISRSWCLVASLSPNRIIIVGGQGALNLVEECELIYVVPALL